MQHTPSAIAHHTQSPHTVADTCSALLASPPASRRTGDPWPEPKNPYTSVTVAQLGAKEQELFSVQEARTAFYEAELQRWRENDAACKAFADAVTPAEKSAKKLTGELMSNDGTDEAQLAAVTAADTTLEAMSAKIPECVHLSPFPLSCKC
jgi:hypothetical protein